MPGKQYVQSSSSLGENGVNDGRKKSHCTEGTFLPFFSGTLTFSSRFSLTDVSDWTSFFGLPGLYIIDVTLEMDH